MLRILVDPLQNWHDDSCCCTNKSVIHSCKVCGKSASSDHSWHSLGSSSSPTQQIPPIRVVNEVVKEREDSSIGNEDRPILHDFVARGTVQHIYEAISHGCDINAPDERGWTPLLLATHRGDFDMVRILLSCGADVHARTRTGSVTSTHIAVQSGAHNILRLLIESHADVCQPTALNSSPLHLTAQSGDLLAAQLLLNAGADPFALDADDRSPLQVAEGAGHLHFVDLVLSHVAASGHDINNYMY